MKQQIILILFCIGAIACKSNQKEEMTEGETQTPKTFQKTGSIEVLDSSIWNLIGDNQVEVLAEGFNWSEGPLWISELNGLIFSDVPENVIYVWTEKEGVKNYLKPSGYTGAKPRAGELGSNGLTLSNDRKLLICQHGNRAVAQMDASLTEPKPNFTELANGYEGKKFNSPNDVIVSKDGTVFFTDPPYGLVHNMDDPSKELDFQGVYKVKNDGSLALLDDKVTRPNGIALSRDESKLYVASSDPEKAIWMEYQLDENLDVQSSRIFADFTPFVGKLGGLPDGMKVHSSGTIFATGPGGVIVFDEAGTHLGTISTGQLTANCAFDDDEKFLYITADGYLMRIKMKE